ncbi:MAG: amidohydrolase family protein [Fusicatenibacter sp.]|nr:amidohydrolase family protein [Lachnospiraceae bacterium]MDY2937485.1 amidohydrolase family protein [Fusicatenibacter sp.]
MFGECHAHIFMDGVDYKKAVQMHCRRPDEQLIRCHLKAYQDNGISFVRDGGDHYGAGVLARSIAEEYGITYCTPVFAIHKKGHYGRIVGEEFETRKEYTELVHRIAKEKGDFIKIMTTGILDFNDHGKVTGNALKREEVFWMIEIAHEEGFHVMVHVNGAQAVIDAAEAGADSIEHGNYQNEESLCCIAEQKTVWVPTVVTVTNLVGCGRYDESVISGIMENQERNLRLGYQKGVVLALGSDAGAYRVLHGKGIIDEYAQFRRILGNDPNLDERLAAGEERIRNLFRKSLENQA